MPYAQLTLEQQRAVSNCDKLIRDALLKARSAIAAMQVAVLDSNSISGEILQSLNPTDIIPTSSGLAGASNVTAQTELSMLLSYQQMLDTWDTDSVRKLHANFVGAANIDGQR